MYGLFRRWQRQGVWARLLTLLQARADSAGLITWEVDVDSTVCRAHQHAAGASRDGAGEKEPPGGVVTEPDDHGLGRSRGGFTTEIHLASEQGQKPLSLLVTAGQRGDSPQFELVLNAIRVPRTGAGRSRNRPLRVRGDKAYSSRTNRAYLRRRGIRCTIPEPADQVRNHKRRGGTGGRPPAFGSTDNTFVVIQPDDNDPAWFASVAVLDEGGYKIVRRDTSRREHDVTIETSINQIAGDLTKWLAARAT